MDPDPMVTVAVACYNSAGTVIDTLNSVFHQSYEKIFLIVSDDYSQDDTLNVVCNWLNGKDRIDRFTGYKILAVDQNTGISANVNRIISNAPTDWIKFIAGDDILLPNCISDNLKYITEYPDAKIVFSQVALYENEFVESNFVRMDPLKYPYNIMDPGFTSEDQFKLLIESDRITFTPSSFFMKQALIDVGMFYSEEKLVEDYPMWLKLTKAGIKLHYFHKPTVGYRVHEKATNNIGGNRLFKPSAINGYKVRRKYAHPYLPTRTVLQEKWVYLVNLLFLSLRMNKKQKPLVLLHRFLSIYANPFFWYNAIYKRII